jgi:nicotinic acid phosphoribosyltransferase
MLAGKLYGIPVKGTMAHSFVTSFKNGPLNRPTLKRLNGSMEDVNLQELSRTKLHQLLDMVFDNI